MNTVVGAWLKATARPGIKRYQVEFGVNLIFLHQVNELIGVFYRIVDAVKHQIFKSHVAAAVAALIVAACFHNLGQRILLLIGIIRERISSVGA